MFSSLFEHILKEEERKDFEEIFQPLSPEEYEKRILDHIKEMCFQNPDGTWSAEGDVNLSRMNLTKLPVRFKEVKGDFNCSINNLTSLSLEGAPKIVGGDFDCSWNKLTSLKGAPKKVKGNFICSYNEITSLEGAPKKVKGYLDCSNNKLTTLEGAPKEVGKLVCAGANPKSVKELKKTINRPYMERIIN